MISNKLISKKNNYCINCGKYRHNVKKCSESITSMGIICTKFIDLPIDNISFLKFLFNKYIEIDNYNFSHVDNIDKLEILKKNIKFLMIQRKHSLSYIEFIRGKYNLNNFDKIKKMFENMSQEEIYKIEELNFDNLWENLWKKTSKIKLFQKEFENSKKKFKKLILDNKIEKLIKIKPLYDGPEWGFPKGRRNLFEKNLDCAIREFTEETKIDINNIFLLNNFDCIIEEYSGTNNINYKHIYYLSFTDNLIQDYYSDCEDNYEVRKIGWYSWDEAINMIRPYYEEKLKIVNQVYFLFLNLYLEYINNSLQSKEQNKDIKNITE